MTILVRVKRITVLVLLLFCCGLAAGSAYAAVDWVVNLDANVNSVPAGGIVEYTVRVTNGGDTDADTTLFQLLVPDTARYTGVSAGFTGCTEAPVNGPATVECTIPALVGDGEVETTFFVQLLEQGSAVVTATIPEADDDPENNTATVTTTVTAGADMAMTIDGPETAASGSSIAYTLTATNNGPDPVTDTQILFPSPVGIADITPPVGCSLSAGTYTCLLSGPIAVGDSVPLIFTGQVSAASGSTITAQASVGGGSPPDMIADNNEAVWNMTVTAGSDLAITKTRSPGGTLLVGDTVTFTLNPSYTGDSPSGIRVVDQVPDNYAITAVTAPEWSCSTVGQEVTCFQTDGSGPGNNISLGSIEIEAEVVAAGAPINTATITAYGPLDPNPANNTATDGGATIQEPFIDLRANKSGPNPALVVVGNSYDFPISSTNIGNAAFYGDITMTDSLPEGLEVTAYTLNGWSCSPDVPVAGPSEVICQRTYTEGAPLAAGATTPQVVLAATATDSGAIVNSMTVSVDNANLPDENSPNNTTSYAVTGSEGPQAADLSVVKTSTLPSLPAGDIQTFSIEVINAGPQPSTSITLTDSLTSLINNEVGPTGAGLVNVSFEANAAEGMSCSTASSGGTSRTLTCNFDTLPICTSGSNCPVVTVQVRPGGNAGSRSNTAEVISSSVADPVLTNNSSTVSYDVEARTDVSVEKSGVPDPAVAGQNVTYVVTAQAPANGLSRADNVTITDTLPADVTFISATPSAGSCSVTPTPDTTTLSNSNNQVVCNLGPINNGAQQTVTIVVRPNFTTRGTTIVNNVAVETSTTEIDDTNNSASVSLPVANPTLDLLVSKTDTVDPLTVGDDTTYRVTVQNLGPSAATNVTITDALPAERISYQSHSLPADGSCSSVPGVDSFGGILACSFPVLPAGDSRVIEIVGRGTTKGVTSNSVTVTSDETLDGFEPNLTNNSATETTTVRTRVNLELEKDGPAPVNLRDPFDFTITLRNLVGAGLAEADDVVLSDTLPDGMELTGTPSITAAPPGSYSGPGCSGAAGDTTFSCDLGTISNGAELQITVPVRVISVISAPQDFTNTATVTTSSFDIDTSNNSDSGTVIVNSSSLAGQVFRDFNDDGILDAEDTGIGGVTMTLTGTALDGTPISRTVTTNADGTYVFRFLPQGTYEITRGVIDEAHLNPSSNPPTVGDAGGTADGQTRIFDINLGGNTSATGYLFAMVPQARIGIAKAVQSGPTFNDDGSFNTTFRLTVRNFSLEPITNMAVTDQLAGVAPLFGTLDNDLAPGTYRIEAAPSGTCGGLNAGFNGDSTQTVADNFTLTAGATCTIDFSIRVAPPRPLPALNYAYENQAVVTGEGEWSGQTSATNDQLQDLSHNGTNPDPNGNGVANEDGENDPTPVAPNFTADITISKNADLSALDSPVAAGNQITYSFVVRNTGNVALDNVEVNDAQLSFTETIGPLLPGAEQTVTTTYALTAGDITANRIDNTATVSGQWGTDPTDVVGDSDTLETVFAGISLVKTANTSELSEPPLAGETVSYAFSVTNTGQVVLTNVVITDSLPGILLGDGPIPILAPGATDNTTYYATYALTQADIDAGQVVNGATATGTYGAGDATVTDADSVTTNLGQSTTLTVAKTIVGDGSYSAVDDELVFEITATNDTNVTLTNVTISDLAATLGTCIPAQPTTLAPGEAMVCSANYTVIQADIDRGFFTNEASATATRPDASTISGSDDATATGPERVPAFVLDKVRTDTTNPIIAGSALEYEIRATNSGNVTMTNVTISDPLIPALSCTPAAPATLAPGAMLTCTGNYTVTAADVAAEPKQLTNTATVTGQAPDGSPVAENTSLDTPLVVAEEDASFNNPIGSPVTLAVLNNDSAAPGRTLDPAAVQITGTGAPGQSLSVPGEGVWSVDSTTGAITFTPEPGFSGDPTPVTYQVADDQGNLSNQATVTVGYTEAPVAADDLSTGNPIGSPVTLDVLANDSASPGRTLDPTTVQITGTGTPGESLSVPGEGVWSVDSTTGAITFTPEPGFSGDPTPVTYLVADDQGNRSNPATVTVEYAVPAALSGRAYLRQSNQGLAGLLVEVLDADGNLVATAVTDSNGNYLVGNLNPSSVGGLFSSYAVQFRDPVSNVVYGVPVSADPEPARNGTVDNSVITGLQLASGVTTVNQDLPLDPSGVVYDAVSRLPVAGAEITLTFGGSSVDGSCLVGGVNPVSTGAAGFYQFLLLNPAPPGCPGDGIYTLQVSSPAGYLPAPSSLVPPEAGVYTPTTGGIDAIQPQAGPPTGGQATTYYLNFDLTLGSSSDVINNHLPLDPVLGGAITLVKSTPLVNVSVGQLVPYTITATNTLAAPLANIDLIDTMPPGFSYRKGSASIDGVALDPERSGRLLRWRDLSFDPGQTRVLKLILVVGAGVDSGEYVNSAQAFNNLMPAPGNGVSNLATSTVRVVPDPVFDCAEIIGKVFDDRNADGYQNKGEPGIPNVRLVTARGLQVTTDAEGRFHIACAAVPNAFRGSNFIMKLDERSLPSGYRVTTENPRTVLLTRGKTGKLNFGAAIHRVLRIEIGNDAFLPNSDEIGQALTERLGSIPDILRDAPSVVRLAYAVKSEPDALVRSRLKRLRKHIEELWKDQGCCYDLMFEEEIFRRDLQIEGGAR